MTKEIQQKGSLPYVPLAHRERGGKIERISSSTIQSLRAQNSRNRRRTTYCGQPLCRTRIKYTVYARPDKHDMAHGPPRLPSPLQPLPVSWGATTSLPTMPKLMRSSASSSDRRRAIAAGIGLVLVCWPGAPLSLVRISSIPLLPAFSMRCVWRSECGCVTCREVQENQQRPAHHQLTTTWGVSSREVVQICGALRGGPFLLDVGVLKRVFNACLDALNNENVILSRNK